MPKNLVIVESPAKAKTIESYLGKEFVVKSSYGHVRDLPKGNNAIDIKNGFRPLYEISEDKKQIVADLEKLARQSDIVWLATDDDREGEAISWHLKEALQLRDDNTKRIVFREITKSAIIKAIQNPRSIDLDLVNAQQARRILDRLVGFELSPILWKKIKSGLSAGRVQSVAVRMVVEREREIDRFNAVSSYKVAAVFLLDKGKELMAELPQKFSSEEQAMQFLQKCIGAVYSIKNLEKKPAKRSPSAPFTTSTLQQEASRKLGYSVTQTMVLAQRLYEAGHISYMRTDSENLSQEAINAAAAEISKSFGQEYVQTRQYKTRSESAQEAHEAIRPTNFALTIAGTERNEQRLYELIWKRAIASQMADARLERTIATIAISTVPENLIATGEVITFEGFLKVYIESTDDEGEEGDKKGMLPPLAINQVLQLRHLKAVQNFSRPAARYTEASLVKKLEEMGIGRPSTYAPTISTIQKRGYIEKGNRDGKERKFNELTLKEDQITTATKTEVYGAEKGKLFPTDLARVVNDFLVEYFPEIVDYSFTAQVEKQFDEIAQGKTQWDRMIADFYGEFRHTVENTESNVDRDKAGKVRRLGTDPNSGKEIIVRLGRFGPLAQIGSSEDEAKPVFASLRPGQSIESITLEEALELFKLPREVGLFEDKKIVAAVGRFGPYLRHSEQFYSLGKDHDPLTVTLETAIDIIHAKRLADANKVIKVFEENPNIRILNGRWGPYIAHGKDNIKIPKDKQATALTLEDCMALIAAAPEKKKPVKGKAATKEKAESKEKTAKKTASAGTKKAAAKNSSKKETTSEKKTDTAKKTTTAKKSTGKKKSE